MIYLTSFFKAKELPSYVKPYSAAVYQPKGFDFPKADWTDIRNEEGQWTRPRNFVSHEHPLEQYRAELLAIYYSREEQAKTWVDSIGDNDVALCCWCPYDKAAKEQLGLYGTFVCHTAVLGEFLTKWLHQTVWYDSDRSKLAQLV